MQTETLAGRGDCIAACVASVLELPLADVPNFTLAADPWKAFQNWLGGRGLCGIWIPFGVPLGPMPDVYCILLGSNKHLRHAVVGRLSGNRCEVAHDPNPFGIGLEGKPEWAVFFGVLSPENKAA